MSNQFKSHLPKRASELRLHKRSRKPSVWQQSREESGLALRFHPQLHRNSLPLPLWGEQGEGDVFKGHLNRFSYLGVFFAAIASATQKPLPWALALCVT